MAMKCQVHRLNYGMMCSTALRARPELVSRKVCPCPPWGPAVWKEASTAEGAARGLAAWAWGFVSEEF